MLDLSHLNILAIIAAWFINIGLGSFWYSPAGFGKLWSKLSGVDMMKMPKDQANTAIAFVAAAAFIQTVALAILVASLHAHTFFDGFAAGLLVWAGFTAATTVGNNLYSRLSWKFWWLNASFFLVVMVVNAAIFAIWQ